MNMFFWGFVVLILSFTGDELGPWFVLPACILGYAMMIIASKKESETCISFSKVTKYMSIIAVINLTIYVVSIWMMGSVTDIVIQLQNGNYTGMIYLMIFAIISATSRGAIFYYLFYFIASVISDIEFEKQIIIGGEKLKKRFKKIIKSIVITLISVFATLIGIFLTETMQVILFIITALVCVVFTILILVNMIIFLVELYKACKQYKAWKNVDGNQNSIKVADVY